MASRFLLLQYIDYLSSSIGDAIRKTDMDGIMLDWFYNPGGGMNPLPPLRWLPCEQVMFQELMNQSFSGKDKITPEIELDFRRKAIDRAWKQIREITKETKPGGGIVLFGMILSLTGVIICGWAGFKKEKDLSATNVGKAGFNMTIGLLLNIVAGVLSGVFNLSLEYGQPIADMAAQNGAGNFQGNAKMVISTSGCFVVNLIWFLVAGIRNGTLKEFLPQKGLSGTTIFHNWLWSALAGTLWTMPFFSMD